MGRVFDSLAGPPHAAAMITKGFRIMTLAAAGLAAVGSAWSAPLEPSGQWVVEYADSMCVLSRAYPVTGTAAGKQQLALRYLSLSQQVELLLVGSEPRGRTAFGGVAKVSFPGTGRAVSEKFWSAYFPKSAVRLTRIQMNRADLDDLWKSPAIEIQLDDRPPVALRIKSIATAIKALDICETDLIRSWNIDPAFRDRIATKAEPEAPDGWITNNDYPADAIRQGKQGVTSMLWRITPEGRVDNCRVITSSGSPLLDKAGCEAVTKRGRYKPAIGKDGKPVESYSSRMVRWVLPN